MKVTIAIAFLFLMKRSPLLPLSVRTTRVVSQEGQSIRISAGVLMFSIIIIMLSSWSMLRLWQAALLVNGCNTPVWVQLLCVGWQLLA